MARVNVATSAEVVADLLREEILARGEVGSFLGSEDDLLKDLGISRPVFRQAVRILEHENLLMVRRGVNGGFYTLEPSADAVTRMAAVVLRARSADVSHLRAARLLVEAECARMAAVNGSEEQRLDLAATVITTDPQGLSEVELRDTADSFHRLIGRLSGNEILSLFVDVLIDLTSTFDRSPPVSKPDRSDVAHAHKQIALAIAAGNGELAARRMRSHLEKTCDWFEHAQQTGLALRLRHR